MVRFMKETMEDTKFLVDTLRYKIYLYVLAKRDDYRFFIRHVKDCLTTIRPSANNIYSKSQLYQCENDGCHKLFNSIANDVVCPHCCSFESTIIEAHYKGKLYPAKIKREFKTA